MSVKIGDQFKLYADDQNGWNGDWSDPNWMEIKCVDSLGMNDSPNEIAINCRGHKRTRYAAGRLDTELTYVFLYDRVFPVSPSNIGDAFRRQLQQRIVSQVPMHIAIADGVIDTVGTEYFEANWIITGFDLTADLDDTAQYDVTMRLDDTSDPAEQPRYVEVT